MKNCMIILFALVVSACSVSTPDCSDAKTQELVLQIANDHWSKFVKSFPDSMLESMMKGQIEAIAPGKVKFNSNYNAIKLSLDDIVTSRKDEKIGKYECKASLVSALDGEVSNTNIEYSSQLANDGEKHLVEMTNLSQEQMGQLMAVIVTSK